MKQYGDSRMPKFQNEASLIKHISLDEPVVDLSLSPVQPLIQVIDIENYSASSNGITHLMSHLYSKQDQSFPNENEDKDEDVVVLEAETDAEKRRRDIAASEDLARRLMAEEAMESYRVSASFLQAHANNYSREDLDMIQEAMGYEVNLQGRGNYDDDENYNDGSEDEYNEGAMSPSSDISYDALLRLGEQIGDVKSERWALRAQKEIAKLPIILFDEEVAANENETKQKCLICQVQYEPKEQLRYLPCDHTFHRHCSDTWLMVKDCCPYCRQSIH